MCSIGIYYIICSCVGKTLSIELKFTNLLNVFNCVNVFSAISPCLLIFYYGFISPALLVCNLLSPVLIGLHPIFGGYSLPMLYITQISIFWL